MIFILNPNKRGTLGVYLLRSFSFFGGATGKRGEAPPVAESLGLTFFAKKTRFGI
jgi:hypothetical protein